MTALLPAARRRPWQSLPLTAPVPDRSLPRATSRWSSVAALAIFLPLWLPKPLLFGEFSMAFAVPFMVALWALAQPAWPGSLRRAMDGGPGRGLWLEAVCVGAIMVLAILSMLVSPEPLRALRVILPMSYSICALILLTRVPPPMQYRLLYALLSSGAMALGVALVLTQTGWGRGIVMRDYRFLGFFENPNQLGLMVVAIWPLAVALLLNARSTKVRLICMAMVLILASAVFISGTKTALLLAFVSGALMWLYHGSRSGSLDRTLVTLAIILCAVVLAVPAMLWVLSWASPAFFRRVDAILTFGVWEFPSMKTRDSLWQESVRIGLAHPLLGAGAGTWVLNRAHSHNMLLDYFRGMGVFALAAAVTLVLSAVSRACNFLLSTWHKGQTDRPSDMILAGLYVGAIFYLIGNQLSDSFSPTTAFPFWMIYFGAYLVSLTRPSITRPDRHLSTVGWKPRPQRPRSSPQPVTRPV